MINIFEPNVGEASKELLDQVFKSKWLGRGDLVNKFEEELCNYLGIARENFHTVASCSDVIFACLQVFDLPKGSKVVIPSNSFPAIPSAIVEAGYTPLIIDIDITSGNICLHSLREHYDNDCSAVFVTDYGGIPNDVSAIREIVGDDGIILVDAAASLGTFVDGKFSGYGADFSCWSFDAMKLLTCGEGGGAYFKDPNIASKFKEYTYLGLSASEKSGLDRSESGEIWWEYNIKSAGRRSVFTNINAAIGLPQVSMIKSKIQHRAEIRSKYLKAFEAIPELNVIEQNKNNTDYSNYFFSTVCDKRNELALFLKDNGVYTTFRYHPTHRIPIFKGFARNCKKCDTFSEHVLNIPIHNSLSEDDVTKIIALIKQFFKKQYTVL